MKIDAYKTTTERKSLVKDVIDSLRDDIIRGEYHEGDRLREIDLSERYGVSRGTIRSALQALVNEGLVEILANGGNIVVGINEKIICDSYQFRKYMEVEAGKTIIKANNIIYTPLMQSLEKCIKKESDPLYQESPMKFYINQDIQFHKCLVLIAGNRPIYRAWCTLAPVMHNMLSLNLSKDYHDIFISNFYSRHKQLADLAIIKDPSLIDNLEKHIDRAMEISLQKYQLLQENAKN